MCYHFVWYMTRLSTPSQKWYVIMLVCSAEEIFLYCIFYDKEAECYRTCSGYNAWNTISEWLNSECTKKSLSFVLSWQQTKLNPSLHFLYIKNALLQWTKIFENCFEVYWNYRTRPLSRRLGTPQCHGTHVCMTTLLQTVTHSEMQTCRQHVKSSVITVAWKKGYISSSGSRCPCSRHSLCNGPLMAATDVRAEAVPLETLRDLFPTSPDRAESGCYVRTSFLIVSFQHGKL